MAGSPIRISVITDAARAIRQVRDISRAVQGLAKVGGLRFDKGAFTREFANPAKASYKKFQDSLPPLKLKDPANGRKFFDRKASQEPVGQAPSFRPNKNVGLVKAFRNMKALSGEARVSLDQLNRRAAHFESVATKAYGTATSKLERFKDSATSTVGKLKRVAIATAAIGIASRGISAATSYLKTAVSGASDLGETTSKATQIFKDGAPAILEWSTGAAKNLGLSQNAALAATSSFGDMFLQLGFGSKQAQDMSTGTLQLASDIASFSNLDVADVTDKLSSAYRGEFDSLQAVVPAITAARVQTQALAMTHKKSAKELTAMDKAAAVNAIVLHDTARSTGDFKRTSDGLANVTRTNKAAMADLSTSIGSALLPAVTSMAIVFRDKVIPVLQRLVDKYAPKVNKFFVNLAKNGFSGTFKANAKNASKALKAIGTAIGTLGKAAGSGFSDTLTVAAVVMKALADHADLLAKAIPFLVAGFLAVKIGQAASTAAAIAALPVAVATVAANFTLAAANRALAIAITGVVPPTILQRISALASAVATGIASAATWVWTSAQAALNAVMALNPVALVVIAIIALVAIIVIAYKKSDRFRAIVDKLWSSLKAGIANSIAFVKANWPKILTILTGPVGLAYLAFTKYKTKILSVFRSIKSGIVSIFKGIGGLITSALKGTINAAIDLINGPLKAVNKVSSKVPGVPDVPLIPKLAKGGIINRPTLVLAGEAGPEAIVPLKGGRFGTTITNINVTMSIASNDPDAIAAALNRKLRLNGLGVAR